MSIKAERELERVFRAQQYAHTYGKSWAQYIMLIDYALASNDLDYVSP